MDYQWHLWKDNFQSVSSLYAYIYTYYFFHVCSLCLLKICPVCSAHPTGQPNHLTDDFPGHLMLDHSRAPREPDLVS